MKIDRDLIVKEALQLLDAEGFDALSLRKLAKRLHVQAPAIYWHVRDKDELLQLMVQALYEREPENVFPNPARPWTEWFVDRGVKLRHRLMQCRDSARLVIETPVSARAMGEAFPTWRHSLTTYGMSEIEATRIIAAFQSFVLGWLHFEQHAPIQAFMASVMNLDESYRFGLEALAEGLRGRIEGKAVGPR